MENYNVVRYSSLNYVEWNEFVSKSKNATFLFHRDFMEYHKDRFDDFSLMVYYKEKLVALFPANIYQFTIYSHQGLTYGSFIINEKIKLLEVFEAFKKMLEYLYLQGVKRLFIKMIPNFYNSQLSDELEYVLFKAKATLVKRDALMVIDYKNQIPFQKKRREGLNKAKRHNLTIQIEDDFEPFWKEILQPNLSSKHKVLPVHSLEEIKLLASRFPENIKQINVYKEDKLVAGTTLFITKTTLHPQYVSGNQEKNKLGSLDFLYDFLINKYPVKRPYFDFNISSEDNGEFLNKGLIFWKESCGARTFKSDNYELETVVYKNLELKLV
ncbi:MAG: GNAT family N-acetyltransferase [Algibacter sp.]